MPTRSDEPQVLSCEGRVAAPRARRSIIVSADDFGLSHGVNTAIERAHRNGILDTTSLMVAAPAAADAVARARSLPHLHVGLHVVLVNGTPALPPERVPDLVDDRGNFPTDLFAAGVRYFFHPHARAQLEAEIRAQFQAFAATGLPLDHVNAQNHMHVHPTVLSLILRVGRDFGVRAIRIPYEPFGPSWESNHTQWNTRLGSAVFLAPWLSLMRRRIHAAGIATNDYVFGMNDTAHMGSERVVRILAHLPEGVSEMYFHPDEGNEELAALVDPRVREALAGSGAARTSFTELAMERAG
ncbi:MAG: hopanoid biosynthesis-associated protein HpnK [Candidatus Eremiobacteraeota bacterium]|nr:hopanoid biosynthesis-associated protein HpnK [Candidatus Eremiobacteraeota bacterium]